MKIKVLQGENDYYFEATLEGQNNIKSKQLNNILFQIDHQLTSESIEEKEIKPDIKASLDRLFRQTIIDYLKDLKTKNVDVAKSWKDIRPDLKNYLTTYINKLLKEKNMEVPPEKIESVIVRYLHGNYGPIAKEVMENE